MFFQPDFGRRMMVVIIIAFTCERLTTPDSRALWNSSRCLVQRSQACGWPGASMASQIPFLRLKFGISVFQERVFLFCCVST